MQKNTNIDKKIPVTIRVTGYIQDIKVLNSGGGGEIGRACEVQKSKAFPEDCGAGEDDPSVKKEFWQGGRDIGGAFVCGVLSLNDKSKTRPYYEAKCRQVLDNERLSAL